MRQFNINNMNIKHIITTFLLAIVAILGGNYAIDSKLGASSETGLKATTTNATTWSQSTREQVLKVGAGKLACFTTTDSTTGTLQLSDGTTTITHANHATTTLAVIAASAAETTYCYNGAFNRGLVASWDSTGPSIGTITWD